MSMTARLPAYSSRTSFAATTSAVPSSAVASTSTSNPSFSPPSPLTSHLSPLTSHPSPLSPQPELAPLILQESSIINPPPPFRFVSSLVTIATDAPSSTISLKLSNSVTPPSPLTPHLSPLTLHPSTPTISPLSIAAPASIPIAMPTANSMPRSSTSSPPAISFYAT